VTADDRWQRVEEVLSGALERQPAERPAFLDAQCCGDEALRQEVGSLLEAHERPGALDRLAPHVTPLVVRLRDSVEPDAGETVGHYRLLERIGGGGMGVVYRARDSRSDGIVALKLMQQRFTEDTTAVKRFQLEASLIAKLDHPNVCTVNEVGETDGRLYFSMPLYEGATLRQRITPGPLPVEDVLDIATQVARGLARAHADGIVHRDIKPSNVFLCADGRVKLLDFGIAKLAGLTLTNSLAGPLGTIGYMSPEQLRGDPVDHRTDIWSLGVVLYEMLAGHRPFRGAAGVVVNAIVHGDPEPLIRLRPDIPDSVSRVANSALLKLPDARCASAEEFAGALLAAQP
jgi:serine/threonine protein kinase